MKKLINKIENIVDEMVSGVIASSNGKLKKVNDYNVIYRSEHNHNNVSLVSGGGSGHEPAHAGYVGKGMLSAAVCGQIFTSPTPDMVLEGIKACKSDKGALLIIKNYTGDKMNFQLAKELAQLEDINVEFVLVNDDAALAKSTTATGRRGVAGTVFVHKCAGAAAEEGKTLLEVKAVAEKTIKNTATVGLGLDACIVPAVGKKGFTLSEAEAEMGLGIHGEPGVKRETMKPVDEFVVEMLQTINDELKLSKDNEVAVIVNGLGSTPMIELYIAAKKVSEELKNKYGVKIIHMLTGNYMTALDMPGFSITVTKLDGELKKYILAPVDTLAIKN